MRSEYRVGGLGAFTFQGKQLLCQRVSGDGPLFNELHGTCDMPPMHGRRQRSALKAS